MVKYLLPILLTLAIWCPAWAGQLVVSSLPYTVNQSAHSGSLWDTITIAGGALSSTTSGITFGNDTHHWLILGPGGYRGVGGHTITFATDWDASKGSTGISVGYRSHDITVQGMRVIAAPAAHLARGSDPTWVPADTNRGNLTAASAGMQSYAITFKKCYLYTTGYGGWNGSYGLAANIVRGVLVDSCEIKNDCYAYVNRSWFVAAAITSQRNLNAFPPTLTYPYSVKVTNSYIWSNAHAACYFRPSNSSGYLDTDTLVVQFDGDTIGVDSRNNRYTVGSTELGAANAYGVVSVYLGPGSYFKNCTVLSGSTYLGGRGFMFIATKAGAGNPAEVSNNRMDIHAGSDVEFPDSAFANGGPDNNYVCGIKIRQGCNGVYLHNNSITVTGDTTASANRHGVAWHRRGECIQYEQLFDIAETYLGPYNIRIENNLCSLKVRTNVASNLYDLAAAGVECANFSDPSFVWKGNRLYSQGPYIYFYGVYDGPARYWTIDRDTVGWLSSNVVKRGVFNLGSWMAVTSNYAKDVYFLSGTTPTACYYWDDVVASAIRTYELQLQQTVKAKVLNINGGPVSGASGTIQDAYGVSSSMGTTGATGTVSKVCNYYYFSQAGDLNGWNPYALTITRPDSYVQTRSVTVSGTTDTLYFPAPDTVVRRTTIATGGPNLLINGTAGFQLRGPKRQVMSLSVPHSFVAFKSYYSSSFANWTRFTAGTAVDSISVTSPYAYYEGAACVVNGDTILHVVNNKTAFPGIIKVIRIDAAAGHTLHIIDTINIPTPGTATISVPASLGGRSAMIEARFSSTGTYTTDNQVQWTVTTDNGATWSTVSTFYAWAGVNIRSGLEQWNSSRAYFSGIPGVIGTTPYMRALYYNGSTWSSNEAPNMTTPSIIYAHREYAFYMTKDSVRIFAWADTSATSCIVTARAKVGVSTWTYDTVYNAGTRVSKGTHYGEHLEVALVGMDSTNQVNIIYSELETAGNPADQVLYTKQLQSWGWDNRVRLSGDDSCIMLAQANRSPNAQGRNYFVQYTQRVSGVWQTVVTEMCGPMPMAVAGAPHEDTVFTVADAAASESSTDSLTFNLTISPALVDNLTYSYTTVAGTALDCSTPPLVSGTVFKARTGTQTILAGETTAQIKVGLCQDNHYTGTLTMQLRCYGFSQPGIRNNALTDSIGTGTIYNIDTATTPTSTGKRVRLRNP